MEMSRIFVQKLQICICLFLAGGGGLTDVPARTVGQLTVRCWQLRPPGVDRCCCALTPRPCHASICVRAVLTVVCPPVKQVACCVDTAARYHGTNIIMLVAGAFIAAGRVIGSAGRTAGHAHQQALTNRSRERDSDRAGAVGCTE